MRSISSYVGAALLLACPAHAQDFSQCDPGKFKEVYSKSNSLRQKILYAQSIDESHFDQIQHNLDGGAKIPVVEDLVIDANLKWNDFRDKRDKIVSRYRFESDIASKAEIYQSYISPLYAKCLEGVAQARPGLQTSILDGVPDDTKIIIRVQYRSDEDSDQKRRFKIVVQRNGKLEVDRNPHRFFTNTGDEFFTITRRSVEERTTVSAYVVNARTGAYPAVQSVTVPARPHVFVNQPIRRARLSEYTHFYAHNGIDDERASVCVDASLSEGFVFDYTTTPSGIFDNRSGDIDHVFASFSPDLSSPQRACVHAKLYAGNGRDASADLRINAIEVKDPTWVDITEKPAPTIQFERSENPDEMVSPDLN